MGIKVVPPFLSSVVFSVVGRTVDSSDRLTGGNFSLKQRPIQLTKKMWG